MKLKITLFILICVLGLATHTPKVENEVSFLFLKHKVLEFANKYRDQDTIIVSKKDHLLYYCKNGKIVRRAQWNGLTFDFPVKVALASRYHRTPEGEMYVDGKNRGSRYIRFLSFSGPGAYGIHSAPTQYEAFLEKMEKKNPNFIFATRKDDTRGCVQVENRVIKYLFAKVDVNTPVLVMP